MAKLTERQWEARQNSKDYVSLSSDNRVFCAQAHRPKYVYETQEKARRAMIYQNTLHGLGLDRSYWCIACGGYHLTRQTIEQNIDRRKFFQETKNIQKLSKLQA